MLLILHSAAAASKTVIVIAGSEEKHYTLHKQLLSYYSGYFRRAFVKERSNWHLDNVSVEGFNVFVDWIYETRLRPSVNTDEDETSCMLSAYLVATELSVGSLNTAILDWIFLDLSDSYLSVSAVQRCFDVLPNNDPLLQLIVDAFCINDGVGTMGVEDFATIDDLPKQYLARVLRKLHQLTELPDEDRVLAREDYSMVVSLNYKVMEEVSQSKVWGEAPQYRGWGEVAQSKGWDEVPDSKDWGGVSDSKGWNLTEEEV